MTRTLSLTLAILIMSALGIGGVYLILAGLHLVPDIPHGNVGPWPLGLMFAVIVGLWIRKR